MQPITLQGILTRSHLKRRAPVGGKWNAEEDDRLRAIVEEHGAKCWKNVSDEVIMMIMRMLMMMMMMIMRMLIMVHTAINICVYRIDAHIVALGLTHRRHHFLGGNITRSYSI